MTVGVHKQLDDRIAALTGIDISETKVQHYIETWIEEAIREIYSFVPRNEKFRYTVLSSSAVASVGITVKEPVASVLWCENNSFQDDDVFEAREMMYSQLYMFNKHYSVFRARKTDPLYYYEPQTSGTAQKIKAYPSDGYIKVIKFDIPNWDSEGSYNANEITTINSLPNEIDHLIVLNASVKATTFLLQSEQDEDIYVPMLNTLKADYVQSVQLYLSQFNVKAPMNQPSSTGGGSKATAEELQKLMQKYS